MRSGDNPGRKYTDSNREHYKKSGRAIKKQNVIVKNTSRITYSRSSIFEKKIIR
jgi:hypothetical protein